MCSRLLSGLPLFLFLALPSFAQTDQNPPPSPVDSPRKMPPASSSTTPPKKVWTNDDLHKNGGVSVVGDKRNKDYPMTPSQTADPGTVSRIRKELGKLSAQLDDTNKKLTELRRFEAGEAVNGGGRQINKGLNRVPVDQQVLQLQESKKKLEAQIGDLLDEARKKGIDPGQLR
jgi:hypothetical protein